MNIIWVTEKGRGRGGAIIYVHCVTDEAWWRRGCSNINTLLQWTSGGRGERGFRGGREGGGGELYN